MAGLGAPARPVRPWLSTLALLAVWQGVTAAGWVAPTVLPAPGTVVGTALGLVADGRLPQALLVSLGRVLLGSAAGVALGVLLGLGAGLWRPVDDVVDRPVQMLRAVPFTALTPLLLLWFGLGEAPKIVLVGVATLVPMYVNTLGGVRAVDPALTEMARAYGLSPWRTAAQVLLPGARPAVLVGLRHALAAGWVAVVVAETVNATAGLGHLLTTARTYARTDVVLVCIVVYALLGLATDGMVRLAERRPGRVRVRRPAAALLVGTLSVVLVACAPVVDRAPDPASDPAPVTLRLGPLTTQNTLTLAAADGGPLAEHVTAVDTRLDVPATFPAFAPAAEAMAAGQVDMTTGSSTALVAALGGNPDLVVFAVEHNHDDTQGIVAGPGTGIASVRDLAGRTVAVNEGGTGEYLLRLALEREGMTVDDVEPVLLGPADAAGAFAAGSVDAWATWDQYLALADGLPGARVIALARDIGGTNRTVHVVSRSFLEDRPDVVRAVYDALVEQAEAAAEDPGLLAEAYLAAGAEPEVADWVADRAPPTVGPADDAFRAELQQVADFYAEQGMTAGGGPGAAVDVSDAVVDVRTLTP